MQFRTDNIAEATAVLRRFRLNPHDAGFDGELRKLRENPGIRASYFRRDGLSVDYMCEALHDAGVTVERPTCREFLDWFENVCTAHLMTRKSGASNRADWNGAEAKLRKAQSNRHRVYRCPSCEQQVNGSRLTAVLCATCRDEYGFPVSFVRIEPLPEEITATGAIARNETPF